MSVLIKEGDRVRSRRKFCAPYNDNIIDKGEEGTVYAVGPAWDKPAEIIHVGVNTDSGKEVSVALVRAHFYWEICE